MGGRQICCTVNNYTCRWSPRCKRWTDFAFCICSIMCYKCKMYMSYSATCVRHHQVGGWPTDVARQRARASYDDVKSRSRHRSLLVSSPVRGVTGSRVGRKWRHQGYDGARPGAGDEATSAGHNQQPRRAPARQPTSTSSCRSLDPVPVSYTHLTLPTKRIV